MNLRSCYFNIKKSSTIGNSHPAIVYDYFQKIGMITELRLLSACCQNKKQMKELFSKRLNDLPIFASNHHEAGFASQKARIPDCSLVSTSTLFPYSQLIGGDSRCLIGQTRLMSTASIVCT
jgi:hypothetical protein